MAIYLDDEATDLQQSDLTALLEAAKEALDPTGRVVVDVQVDGESLGTEALDAPAEVAIEGKEVRLYSADPKALALEILTGIRQRLGDADAAQQEAAALFQADDSGEALGKVGEAIEAWLQTQEAVLNSAMLLGIDLESFKVDGEALKTLTDELLGQLQALRSLIEAGDTVALADALEYEWPALTERWDGLVAALAERIERG